MPMTNTSCPTRCCVSKAAKRAIICSRSAIISIAADKTSDVLGQAIPADVTIVIVNDGARINSINITYTIPASGQNAEITMEIKAFYGYDLEILNIAPGVSED